MNLDSLEKRKRLDLVGFSFFFGLWQIGHIADFHFKLASGGSAAAVFGVLVVVGVIGYLSFTWRFFRTRQLMRQAADLCKNLNDERARLLRLRAMSYGFIACIGLSAAFLATLTLARVFGLNSAMFTGAFVGHVTLVAGIICFWLALLILDKE